VNVERRARRGSPEVPEQIRRPGSAIVRIDRLGDGALPQREPRRARAVVVDRRIGRALLFVNGENLMDVRQTRWEPLLRPARGFDGRWTVDAWAPLDGRNINAGVRLAW